MSICISLLPLDLDFCKAGQVRSPDYHIHQQQQQQQHPEEEDEVLCAGSATHIHSRGYSLGVGSDVDTEPEVDPSPNHALQHMWMRGLKSEQSSCLTSRANSALSLTDTEHDRKSEPDNGERHIFFLCFICKKMPLVDFLCTFVLVVNFMLNPPSLILSTEGNSHQLLQRKTTYKILTLLKL